MLAAAAVLVGALFAVASPAQAAPSNTTPASDASTARAAPGEPTAGEPTSADSGVASASLGSSRTASPTPDPGGGLGATPPPTPRPPTITSPQPGTFIGSGHVTVTGTKDAGAQLQVRVEGSEPACVIDHGRAEWSCEVPLPDGEGVTIEAVELSTPENLHASVTVASLGPPTIDVGEEHLSSGPVHGTAYPGATVTATADTGQTCSFPANGSGKWACVLSDLPGGTHTVTATQKTDFGASRTSDPVTLTIDVSPPAAPVILTPRGASVSAGSGKAVVFRGTGEPSATVTVYANQYTLCSGLVAANGTWSCTGRTVPDGDYSVAALQTDPAGNWSRGSRVLTISWAAAQTPPQGKDSPEPSSPTPSSPHSHPPRQQDNSGASPTPGTSSPTPSPSVPGPAGPPSTGGGSGWGENTPFTSAVKPALSPDALPGWLRSLVLALAGLVLLVLPARLLATFIAARRSASPARPRMTIFGRNRPIAENEEHSETGTPRPWLTTSTILVAAAAMISLAGPVADLPAYLRLLGAVLLAVLVVNAVAVVVSSAVARRMPDLKLTFSPAPRALVLVAAGAVLSRALDLQPALLFGVVAAVVVSESATVVARGRMAAVQIASVAVLGALAWLFLSVVSADTLPVFAAEALNALVLVSIGSAAVGVVPLGKLPGRALFAWSRSVWLGVAIVVLTLLIGLLIPVGALWQHGLDTVVVGALMLVFAGVSVSFWLWQRYIQPSLD